MLTTLQVTNFKAWEDTGPLRLAPITVLFGTNSSGKSSLAQLLLMLKQTVESSDRSRVLHTGDSQSPVDLGTFSDLVHRHDVTRHLGFALGWTNETSLEIEDVRNDAVRYVGRDLQFNADIYQPEGRASGGLRVRDLRYTLTPDGSTTSFAARMEPHPKQRTKYKLAFDGFTEVWNVGRKWELPGPSRFYGFPDEAVAYYQNTYFLPDLSLALERTLRSISYLGPLRVNPERVYTWSGGAPEHVGWSGEQTVEAILAARGRSYNFVPKQKLHSLEEVVASELRTMGLIDSFRVVPIAEGRPEREVRVTVTRQSEEVLLTDVGFGISQVLPVLVQSFYAAADSTVIMEQPELHLHPSVQKGLADFFIRAIRAREEGARRNMQFLIESHSEHFLRRLQRRIAERDVSPDDVALYFCEVSGSASVIRELEVDPFGNILNWPVDFFGDPIDDVAAQAEARLKRQIATDGQSNGLEGGG